MSELFIDLETYSECDLKKHATPRYARHPSTEVTLIAWAIDDGEVQLVDRTRGEKMPRDLIDAIKDTSTPMVIQNSFFDRTVMRETGMVPAQYLHPSRIHDTMVQALCHGLPGGLDILCQIYGLPMDLAKSKEGRMLILKFCKPNRGKRITEREAPELWENFREYAKSDIRSMRELYKNKLPTWNYPYGPEYDLWVRDQLMNDRGFGVDIELATAAIRAAKEEKDELNSRTSDLTAGEVEAATQRDKLLKYILEAHGVSLPDMKTATLERRANDPDLPWAVRELLNVRLMSSRSTAAKYVKVVDCEVGGRLMGTTQFSGASRTMRDAGRVFQHQNLMRPTMWREHEDDPAAMDAAIAQTIAEIKDGSMPYLYSNIMDVLGNCIRSVIVAPEGRVLHAADLSNIEGRGLVWLAGEEWKVQYFRDFDAGKIKYDNYVAAYAKAMNVDPADVDKSMRAIGKVMELALGYEGGVAAFLTFVAIYRLDLDVLAEAVWATGDLARLQDCERKHEWAKKHGYNAGLGKFKYAACEYLKQMWRESHEATVKFWALLKKGFAMAVQHQGQPIAVGKHIKFLCRGHYLRMRLPSGKSLTYLKPFVQGDSIGFYGVNQYTKQYGKIFTHGGKLAENATSGTARDVLFRNIPRVEEAGYEPVFRVHDELVAETDEDFDGPELAALIATNHDWCLDLPLAAEGFITTRYRK